MFILFWARTYWALIGKFVSDTQTHAHYLTDLLFVLFFLALFSSHHSYRTSPASTVIIIASHRKTKKKKKNTEFHKLFMKTHTQADAKRWRRTSDEMRWEHKKWKEEIINGYFLHGFCQLIGYSSLLQSEAIETSEKSRNEWMGKTDFSAVIWPNVLSDQFFLMSSTGFVALGAWCASSIVTRSPEMAKSKIEFIFQIHLHARKSERLCRCVVGYFTRHHQTDGNLSVHSVSKKPLKIIIYCAIPQQSYRTVWWCLMGAGFGISIPSHLLQNQTN